MLLFVYAVLAIVAFFVLIYLLEIVRLLVGSAVIAVMMAWRYDRKELCFKALMGLAYLAFNRAHLYYAAWTVALIILARNTPADDLMRYAYMLASVLGVFATWKPYSAAYDRTRS